jgi:hypothetical protein
MFGLPLLAGRGGEGKEQYFVDAAGSGRWWGFPSASVLRRGTEQMPLIFSVVPSWWRAMELEKTAAPFSIKRCRPRSGSYADPWLSSAGRGGEGVESWFYSAAGVLGRLGRSMEAVISAAVPKQRRFFAAAISGRRSGPAALEQGRSSFLSLLGWRVSSGLAMAFRAAASPSGSVPGGGCGGRVCRFFVVDGDLVLDRVSAILCGVLLVRVKDFVVIFLFLKVLSVIVRPPPF